MLSDKVCKNCNESFAENEQIVNAAGETWHSTCFVCAQCFQPFGNGIYFEYDNRKYCERDFQMLFAPCCAKCNRFIIGRVIRALQQSWHPDCFRCELCHKALIEMGFLKNAGSLSLDENCLKYKGESYHAYHFRCQVCSSELNENAREVRGELYCLRCYDQLEVAVCAACRTQIEDRVINALGKQWHVEHFACGRCEKPFLGSKHYEKNGIAYCETDYHHLFGNTCFVCNTIISGDVFTACNKTYCVDHFACMICETKMDEKSKFYDVDAKPVCKKCFNKLPSDVRKQIERKKKGNKN
ncbi:unnamed protein product [Didymodactylos carnosus]|uniref:LIM zinc-binding domain-containing protein n=1 Tax=Didymodactylos carnosus TaxID=1234261 RepID=A0A813RWN4_9BILA|nr:unnamed protein product [Didymodactylos carnosus]CAF0788106.1 unnamed protein product [Didymodactylos carnosus]CAF3516401.1 unnamed protein product [Didymodactylos carnosus]CAF3572143.1 unnamed protein product [Didymodactylos carnosus]